MVWPFDPGDPLGPPKPVNPEGASSIENRGRGSTYTDPNTGQVVSGAVDPVTGQREDADTQLQNDFLYGGAPGAAQAFNQQTAGIASKYGTALSDIGSAAAGAGQQYANATQQLGGQYGNEVSNLGQGSYGTGQGLLGAGASAYGGANPNAYVDPASLQQSQTDAASMTGAAAGTESAAAKLLNMNFGGPSAAEAQLNAGAQQATAQNLALAQSGRGMGGSAAARRAAMAQNSQVMGQMNGQAASLRAQETATQNQERMQAAQAAGGLYGTAGSTYGGAAGVNSQNLGTVANARNAAVGNANQLGLGLTNAGVSALGQGISGVNAGAGIDVGANTAAGNLALGGLAQDANATGQAGTTELAGQQIQNATNVAAQQGTESYESDLLNQRAQNLGNAAQNNQNSMANQSANLSMAGTLLTSAAQADRQAGGGSADGNASQTSDRRAKTDIQPLTGGDGSDAARFRASLDDFKRGFQPVGPSGAPSPAAAQDAIRNAPGYAFRYKDPERHGEGQRVGVMAQDLEKTPAGAAAVMRTPDGTRAVDNGEAATIALAGLHGQQRQLDGVTSQQGDIMSRLDELDRKFKSRRPSFEAPPAVDTNSLDWAYSREANGYR
jgi:hypothetical protein